MTKYYLETNNSLIEKPLNKDNLWYVQLDGTIRTIYTKYNSAYPKIVIVQENSRWTTINIFRSEILTTSEAAIWLKNWILIYDELQSQAEANSTDEIQYKFELL